MSTTASVATTAYGTTAAPLAGIREAIAHQARITAIDVMRGLVMLFMLVDHMRETVYLHKQVSDPIDVLTVEPALFFTRLSAHLCAPTFVFLTGLGAWLYAHPPSGAVRSPSGFLFKRGLLLVLLEITLVSFSWTGEFPPSTIWLQVIWAIGLSMMVLAALVKLPYTAIAALGLAIVFGHNALSPISFQPDESGYSLWTILHDRGFLVADGPLKIKISYPVLPWIGVILLGYVAGPLYGRAFDAARRVRSLLLLGAGWLLLLLLLRGFNIYGETLPWVAGSDGVHTLMSWLNFTKYPPSLDFLLLTLGGAFLLLAWFEHLSNPVTQVIKTFGGAPMFFYLLHLYSLLVLYKIAFAVLGPNQGTRFGVDHVYLIWVFAVALAALLYIPTRAFADYKRTSKQAWVRYF
jgi:uncharacterized membrane protein